MNTGFTFAACIPAATIFLAPNATASSAIGVPSIAAVRSVITNCASFAEPVRTVSDLVAVSIVSTRPIALPTTFFVAAINPNAAANLRILKRACSAGFSTEFLSASRIPAPAPFAADLAALNPLTKPFLISEPVLLAAFPRPFNADIPT